MAPELLCVVCCVLCCVSCVALCFDGCQCLRVVVRMRVCVGISCTLHDDVSSCCSSRVFAS